MGFLTYPWILIIIKLVVAMLCGGAIGIERELARKAAGLRTVLRSIEDKLIQQRRMFHYTLLTKEPAEFLERLMDLLQAEGLRLDDFEIKELPSGQHEVKASVTTSMDANRRLLTKLPHLGTGLRTVAQANVD